MGLVVTHPIVFGVVNPDEHLERHFVRPSAGQCLLLYQRTVAVTVVFGADFEAWRWGSDSIASLT